MNQVEVKQNEQKTVDTCTAAHTCCFQVNALEQDASEVLSLVLSLKNSFAPINRIPPEVLSLILNYCDKDDKDRDLIALTHVCHGWRDMFISRSSLWTQLDFMNDDKTRTYIQRSKSSPLEIYLESSEENPYLDDTFFLVIPHHFRLKSLTIRADDLPEAIGILDCHAPLLQVLDISLTCPHPPVLDSALFNGDFSSLRELTLGGVITPLPWSNLANLTIFNLKSCRPGHDFVTRLLDFFECAPLLHTIILEDSIPKSSDAPPDRIVPLPHLSTYARYYRAAGTFRPLKSPLYPHRGITDSGIHLQRQEIPASRLPSRILRQPRESLSYHHDQPPLRRDEEVHTTERTKRGTPHTRSLEKRDRPPVHYGPPDSPLP